MIRKRKEKKLVKSKRKVSCFGCHFKIKNFTMSTCLLLLYCYVPQSMIKIISWNRFHGKTCGKNSYPPTHTLIMPPIVYCRPLPPYCCYVRSSYICIRKKLPFPLQKYTEIFSSPEFSRRTYMPCRWTPIRRNYVKLHLEKKSSKKKSAWWKRTLLSADVWKKKKVLNVKFFLTCSRATSSEEQICLKTKILIEVYGKKKKTTMKETKQTTFICYYCWLTLTKSIFSWNQFFTKISILYLERNREQTNKQTQIYMKSPPEDLSEQKMMMISKISLMSKTMRRKKINVQNLPYMIQYENSFRKSQISVTTLLAFQE